MRWTKTEPSEPAPPPAAAERKPAARKRFGQHFLDPLWIRRLVEVVRPGPGDFFVEIGAGRGGLTLAPPPAGARVLAVEVDRHLAATLAARVPPGVEVLAADFLHLELASIVDARIRSGETLRVAGNIPYNISTPILVKLLDLAAGGLPIRDAHLMFQREVAVRIVAGPGSRHYGPLAVITQLYAEAERVLTVPPGAFRPPPRVYSALVRLIVRPPRVTVRSPDAFRRLVRGLFTHRRKTVANALKLLDLAQGRDIEGLLRHAQIAAHRRPETLRLEELARLADLLAAPGG